MHKTLLPHPPQELRLHAYMTAPHLPYRLFDVLPPGKSFKLVTLKTEAFLQEKQAVKQSTSGKSVINSDSTLEASSATKIERSFETFLKCRVQCPLL